MIFKKHKLANTNIRNKKKLKFVVISEIKELEVYKQTTNPKNTLISKQ